MGKVGTVAVAYNEARLIGPHLEHIPLEIDDRLVLISSRPWHGEPGPPDSTERIARHLGATVAVWDWPTEHAQRNTGQDYHAGLDWVIHLDPDEFLLPDDWARLLEALEHAPGDAYTVARQHTYWRRGYRIDPPEPYRQLIAARPSVRFTALRDSSAGAWWQLPTLPVELHHFSWARTHPEMRSKLAHYGHAAEIPDGWLERVWQAWTPEDQDLHPTVPATLKRAVPCELPAGLEHLWP